MLIETLAGLSAVGGVKSTINPSCFLLLTWQTGYCHDQGQHFHGQPGTESPLDEHLRKVRVMGSADRTAKNNKSPKKQRKITASDKQLNWKMVNTMSGEAKNHISELLSKIWTVLTPFKQQRFRGINFSPPTKSFLKTDYIGF